jgi:hypothetical protein
VALLLRIVQRRTVWEDFVEDPVRPVEEGSLSLPRDFFVDNAALSVFHIADDERNLAQVLAAMAAGRNKGNVDYLLFPEQYVQDTGLTSLETAGATLDDEVNGWHSDLVHLGVRMSVVLGVALTPQPPSPHTRRGGLRLHENPWRICAWLY